MDKVTCLSTINDYHKGGLKMIDLETMCKSLRLAWLKRIFSENGGTWKYYLNHLSKSFGGLFLFQCNYHIKEVVMYYTLGHFFKMIQIVEYYYSNLWIKILGKILE